MKKFEAVIFDMDGLMFDTERLGNQIWKKVAKELHIDAPSDMFLRVIGRTKADGKKIMKETIGKEFDYEKVKDKRMEYYYKYIEEHGTPIKKGLIELLDYLDKNNIKKAIASSSYIDVVSFLLKNANIVDRFNVIITGDEVKNGKPNPEIFIKASSKLKIEPSKCLVLEDSNPGIKSANLAGMESILIPDLLKPTEESRKLVLKECSSLLDVIEILEQENSPV